MPTFPESDVTLRFRVADAADAAAVAALHADSWRRHYRGAYTDDYLDGPIEADRLAVWSVRLAEPAGTETVLAVDGGLVGFVHVVLDADPTYGALIDNLHVRHDAQRRGIGAALMARAASAVAEARPSSPIHLWVLEQNVDAQAFYRSIGGEEADRADHHPPGGGTVVGVRYVWWSAASLRAPRSAR